MRLFRVSIALVLLLSLSSVLAQISFERKLFVTRELLTRPNAKALLEDLLAADLAIEATDEFKIPKGKNISETQFLTLLDQNPEIVEEIEKYIKQVPKNSPIESEPATVSAAREKWRERFSKVLTDEKVREKFRAQNNPLEPYIVSDEAGYSDLKTYVNHETILDGKTIPGDDLKQVWIDEIRKAKKEIAINVFDFDLEDVADELIEAKKRGVAIKVGIDAGVIELRPEVKKVYDKLIANGIMTHAVDSVGLNHQKLMAVDWSLPGEARALMSSGNLTQSCIGSEGDLVALPKHLRPKFSVPNANHIMVLKSDIISNVIAHEISKTVDVGFRLRGSQYPLGGIYQIWGDADPKNAGNRPYIKLAFSPNGALDSINKNFISQTIVRSSGSVKMAQFAFSSSTVNDALFTKAKSDLAKGGKFVFKSVGDTPFAMMEWSNFLKMSGLELIRPEDKTIPPKYQELADSEWKALFNDSDYAELKSTIRVAPDNYGNFNTKIGEESYKVSSKIHHKVLVAGEPGKQVAVTGSFNFSKGAEASQEYIIETNDQRIVRQIDGAIEYLHANSKGSVFDEANARNVRRQYDELIPIDDVGNSTLKSMPPPNCKNILDLMKH